METSCTIITRVLSFCCKEKVLTYIILKYTVLSDSVIRNFP